MRTHAVNTSLGCVFATSPNWSLIIAIIALFAGLTAFGFWFKRRQGLVKMADGPARSLSAAELGGALGEAATLAMFSTRFCSVCPGARVLYEGVVIGVPGAKFYEIDAERELGVAKRFGVKSTPTTLVLNASGEEVARIIGAPKRDKTLEILKRVSGAKPVAATKGASE